MTNIIQPAQSRQKTVNDGQAANVTANVTSQEMANRHQNNLFGQACEHTDDS